MIVANMQHKISVFREQCVSKIHFLHRNRHKVGLFGTYLDQGSHSTGCRTQALAPAQATACSAWACMAARAVCRRKVCGAAPQDVELLKALQLADGAPGPAELCMLGLDPEGQDHIVGR